MMESVATNSRKWVSTGFLILAGIAMLAWGARRVWNVRPADPDALLKQAHAAWKSGRLAEAESNLAALSDLGRPPSVSERLLRAQVAKDRGRIDLALAALDGVPDSDPNAAMIWQTRGLLEFDRNRAAPAESALLRALVKNPRSVEARRALIDLYVIQGRRDDLGGQFKALARSGALSFDDLYLWCLGRRQDIGPAEMTAKLEQMLKNDHADRISRLALAENHRRLGRLAEAEADLAPLGEADPDARAARVRVAIDRGAVDDAGRLLEEGPADHPGLARLRGQLALARGDVAALDHFRAVLARLPDDRDALFGAGQSLRLAGKSAEGEPYLEAARARDHLEWQIQNARSSFERDDPKVLSALGDACRSVGRLPEAQGWYRLALARDPLAAELQKRLFELDAAIARENEKSRLTGPRR
jgi:tetratricopeptide (TPR) repeat protein